MKLYIGLLPDQSFRDIYEEHVEELVSLFGLPALARKRRVPHIPLKQSFQIREEGLASIEEAVEKAYRGARALDFVIDSYGRFDDRVIYLSPQPLKNALDLRRKVQGALQHEGIMPKDHDLEGMHVPLAKARELGDKFEEVWNYVNRSKIDELRARFDRVAILRKEDGLSKVVREYGLNSVNTRTLRRKSKIV